MVIKLYEEKYRDDMIFMVLEAKDALGRRPALNPDLLDITANYFDKGTKFWLAIDEEDRVIGCVGYSLTDIPTEAFIHRLYVKASKKRKGIGTALLKNAEEEMRSVGITTVHVHLGEPKEEWFESYEFYPKHGYVKYDNRYMKKKL